MGFFGKQTDILDVVRQNNLELLDLRRVTDAEFKELQKTLEEFKVSAEKIAKLEAMMAELMRDLNLLSGSVINTSKNVGFLQTGLQEHDSTAKDCFEQMGKDFQSFKEEIDSMIVPSKTNVEASEVKKEKKLSKKICLFSDGSIVRANYKSRYISFKTPVAKEIVKRGFDYCKMTSCSYWTRFYFCKAEDIKGDELWCKMTFYHGGVRLYKTEMVKELHETLGLGELGRDSDIKREEYVGELYEKGNQLFIEM